MAWRRSLKKDGAALRWQAARARPPSGLDRLLASTHWPRTAAWAWQLPAFPAGGPRASADRQATEPCSIAQVPRACVWRLVGLPGTASGAS
jgi:hypothetical protein